MDVKTRIQADLKASMLAKDELATSVLRMLKADLTHAELTKGGDLLEDEARAVLRKAVKSREDSALQYAQGGREDAAKRERDEIAIIGRYLPAELSEEATRIAIEAIVRERNLSGMKDLGPLMREIKARHGDTIRSKLAAQIARGLLS